MPGEDLETGVQPSMTQAPYAVHRPRKGGGEGAATAQPDAIHPRSKALIQLWASSRQSQNELLHSGKVNMYPCRPQATHLVTIAGCSAHWNPCTEARRHEQIFGDRRGLS
jgi:hypothetical protein